MKETFSVNEETSALARSLARYSQHTPHPWRWSLACRLIAAALATPKGPAWEERKALALQALHEVGYPGLPAEEDEP